MSESLSDSVDFDHSSMICTKKQKIDLKLSTRTKHEGMISFKRQETSTSSSSSSTILPLSPLVCGLDAPDMLSSTTETISSSSLVSTSSVSLMSSEEAHSGDGQFQEVIPASPSRALGPPTLYCDGAHVIRRVLEVDGKFVALKKGDHCMAPLNLARGLNASVDSFVDQLADFDLIQFHHHFLVLDSVTDVPEGEEAYVAEFTNTPDDFIHKANRVGYSAAFLDKASYKKTPLSDYHGAVIFKVIEENELSEQQRDLIVERAEKSIRRSDKNMFRAYNLFLSNCEHAATEVIHHVKMQAEKEEKELEITALTATADDGQGSNMDGDLVTNEVLSLDENINGEYKLFDNIIETVQNTTARSSPQVTFALWNMMRWFIQIVGVIFLHHIHANWWFRAAVAYSILSAAPPLMQSIANFSIVVYKLRKLSLRGSLRQGSFRHLLLKELFRCILVGFGSTLLILLMPIAVWSNYWPLSVATIVALFGFIILNSIYSIVVKAVHKMIILVKKVKRRYVRNQQNTSPTPLNNDDTINSNSSPSSRQSLQDEANINKNMDSPLQIPQPVKLQQQLEIEKKNQ